MANRRYVYYPRDGRVVIDSRKLRYWRDAREMTRDELAEAARITVRALRAYETGWRCPSQETFRRIFWALGIGPEDLLFDGTRWRPPEE